MPLAGQGELVWLWHPDAGFNSISPVSALHSAQMPAWHGYISASIPASILLLSHIHSATTLICLQAHTANMQRLW